jgi:hypothetical protein
VDDLHRDRRRLAAQGLLVFGQTQRLRDAGLEYLYIYMDAAHARADFENWRREPLEKITLSLDGIEQPGGRVPLTEEEIRKYFEAREQDEEWDFGAEEAQ